LHGEWEFDWVQLLEPEDFPAAQIVEKPAAVMDYVNLPGMWNRKIPGSHNQSEPGFNADGFGTYRLSVLLPESMESLEGELAIDSPGILTAYKLYVNGTVVLTGGTVGEDADSAEPGYIRKITPLYTRGPRLELILQVSNFTNRRGRGKDGAK